MNHPDYRHIAQSIRNTTEWDDAVPLAFPEEGADVYNLAFRSRQAAHLLGQPAYRCEFHEKDFGGEPASDGTADCELEDNLEFRYPLLKGHGEAARSKHLIILLHGLNERSYSKYVPWAYQLWRQTGAAVALFPLSFHVNRVEPNWGREIKQHLARRQEVGRNENVHAFNCVLSERLDTHPERFFWGGLQSYGDVTDLVRQIRAGDHPYVDPAAQIDLLGYSAGGYLSLGLMLGDEDGLFKDSRCVLFASGAVLRSTHLSTRLIMDMACEISLMKLYVRFTQRLATPRLAHWLEEHEEGRWFRALFGEESERARLEARLKEIAPRLVAVANSNDDVIPAGAVLNTMQGLHRDTGVRVETIALGVHEHPFVCPDYKQKDRRFITEFLDVPVMGAGFEKFIGVAAGLFTK
ncbi:MAG: DUF6051 family protein [Archangium sp.]|nr:DUF6051 family protein [Archangium sp.]MDP3152117.1 DUF6051 family protein [Archangium sp.]MDP3575001.1 DUF6051 family protein [Archangium sp.]